MQSIVEKGCYGVHCARYTTTIMALFHQHTILDATQVSVVSTKQLTSIWSTLFALQSEGHLIIYVFH